MKTPKPGLVLALALAVELAVGAGAAIVGFTREINGANPKDRSVDLSDASVRQSCEREWLARPGNGYKVLSHRATTPITGYAPQEDVDNHKRSVTGYRDCFNVVKLEVGDAHLYEKCLEV